MADTRTACAILKSYPLKKAKLFLVKSKAIFCKKKKKKEIIVCLSKQNTALAEKVRLSPNHRQHILLLISSQTSY